MKIFTLLFVVFACIVSHYAQAQAPGTEGYITPDGRYIFTNGGYRRFDNTPPATRSIDAGSDLPSHSYEDGYTEDHLRYQGGVDNRAFTINGASFPSGYPITVENNSLGHELTISLITGANITTHSPNAGDSAAAITVAYGEIYELKSNADGNWVAISSPSAPLDITAWGPEQVDTITVTPHDWDWNESENFLFNTALPAVTINYPTNVDQGQRVSTIFQATGAGGTTVSFPAPLVDHRGDPLPDLVLAQGEAVQIEWVTTNGLFVAAYNYPAPIGNIYRGTIPAGNHDFTLFPAPTTGNDYIDSAPTNIPQGTHFIAEGGGSFTMFDGGPFITYTFSAGDLITVTEDAVNWPNAKLNINADTGAGGLETVRVNASAGTVALTLPPATGTEDAILYTLVDGTNGATIAPASGESLNGAVDATFTFSIYASGSQFLATDRSTGNWDITVIGASGTMGREVTTLDHTIEVTKVSGAGVDLTFDDAVGTAGDLSILGLSYFDEGSFRYVQMPFTLHDDDQIFIDLGENAIPAAATIEGIDVYHDGDENIGALGLAFNPQGGAEFYMNKTNGIGGVSGLVTIKLGGVADGQVVLAGMVPVGDLEEVYFEDFTIPANTRSRVFTLPNGDTWNDVAAKYEKLYWTWRQHAPVSTPVSQRAFRVDDAIDATRVMLEQGSPWSSSALTGRYATTTYLHSITGTGNTVTMAAFATGSISGGFSGVKVWGVKKQKTVINDIAEDRSLAVGAEVDTGRTLQGKPIYRRTYMDASLTNNTIVNVDATLNTSIVERVVDWSFNAQNNGGNTIYLLSDTSPQPSRLWVNATGLQARVGGLNSTERNLIWVEFTKQ